MSKFIVIKVTNNIKRFINKCRTNNFELYDINYVDKNNIIIKIKKEDLENIKKYNYYSEINIYKNMGFDYLLEKIKNLKYFITCFILLLLSMFLISNIILKINVIHSNKKIRELVTEELYSNGIKKYSYKKNFLELEQIKNKILKENKEKLEWISITNIGMTYIVRVEERIIDNIVQEHDFCNIISTKEALITNIYSNKGNIIVNKNDIVKKDDILISGELKLNEKTKNFTCANGKVLGRVWYTTNISVKRDYTTKIKTGKERYNLIINHKVLRNKKYNKYDKKIILKNKWLEIYKEIEYKETKKKYKENDAQEKALAEIDKKFKSKLGTRGNVIDKKILKKEINDKEIILEVFVTTEENISKQIKLNKIQINIQDKS